MEKFLAGLKLYIKQNWLFLVIMCLGTGAFFLQMTEVVLYADDYSLGIYANGDPSTLLDYFTTHYTSWGGGYTGVLVILSLSLPMIIWKLFFTFMISSFVGLSTKMICYRSPKQKWLVSIILWSCIFLLSIWVSREVLYWLDGGMAYLFSMFQAFLVFYFFYTRLFQNITKKYDYLLLPLIAFFGGWSSAQSGVISIFICLFLLAWQLFIKKQKTKKLYLFSAFLSIIGFLIFYFAPGNSVRMDTFAEYSNYNIFEKVAYRSGSVTSLLFNTQNAEFTSAPIFAYLSLGLIAFLDLKLLSTEKSHKLKRLRKFCVYYNFVFILGFFISRMNIPEVSSYFGLAYKYINLLNLGEYGSIGLLGLLPYLAVLIAIISSLASSYFICKRQNSPLLLCVLLTAYLAEFSMVMAPYSPLRTTFYSIAFFWLTISYLLPLIKSEEVQIFPLVLVIFTTLNFNLGILLLIAYVIISLLTPRQKFTPRVQIYLFVTVLIILSTTNFAKTLVNYHRNRIINEENISLLLDAKTTYQSGDNLPEVLYLKKPFNETYGFTGLTGIEWVENAVKTYFELPLSLKLQYQEGENQ